MRAIRRIYAQAGRSLNVLQDISLSIEPGEIVALVGPSGSGKSTLLHIAGLLDSPDYGTLTLDGQNCAELDDAARTAIRRDMIGFIYQSHHLLPEFTACENIMMPQMISGVSRKTATARAMNLLSALGLGERADHRPARLSGGEQQRVAIGRALANGPRLILADEPTGNLDPETSANVFASLLNVVRKERAGALIATHNMDLAEQMDRVLELRAGRVFGV